MEGRGRAARQARNWCFTINFGEHTPPYDLDWLDFPPWVSYVCWQEEVGEQGTHHLQGYLECVGKRSLHQLLAIPGFDTQSEGYSVHLAPRGKNSSQSAAIAYCKKVDDTTVRGSFQEHGEKKEQGRRTDYEKLQADLKDPQKSFRDVWEENFQAMLRSSNGAREYRRINMPPRNAVPRIVVLYGPSGVGKSRKARADFPGAYWKPPGTWWDDYDYQSVVVFDEFRGDYPFRELLRVLDSTELRVPVKGSFVQLVATTFVFTSNYHPSEWYSPDSIHFQWDANPLHRRLIEWGEIIYMQPPAPPVTEDGDPSNGHVRVRVPVNVVTARAAGLLPAE